MTNMKRILSLIIALILMLTLALPAFADEGDEETATTTTITIEGGAAGAEYSAYRLLDATDGGDGKFAYTLNSKYTTILQSVTGKTEQAGIIDYISDVNVSNIREFADAVFAALTSSIAADKTTNTGAFTDMPQGYYLIVKTRLASDSDTYSLVMLDTKGQDNVSISAKEDKPTLTKKLQETNDSTRTITDWQDGADYDIGDKIPFRLTGTVSQYHHEHDTYYYVFHDDQSQGLTFDADSVEVYINGDTTNAIDDSKYEVVTTNLTDGCTFHVVFDNLNNVSSELITQVIVDYEATLNENAVIGSQGNPNQAKLEFSNNPYWTEGENHTTGKTPWDKVIVFTYQTNVNKVTPGTGEDENGKVQNIALKGAGFTLYKYIEEEKEYVAVGGEVKGADLTTFKFVGLDAGKYKIVETTVPQGYNKAEDVEFEIKAEYQIEADNPEFISLQATNGSEQIQEFVVELEEGKISGILSVDIVNLSGIELPSTGGIGTTIFYVGGGILVLAAVVLLVTKRRMNADK